MPIGTTGIQFVALLPAILRPWGPEFSAANRHQAELRAATTLAQMMLIRGQSFRFMRMAIPMTEAELSVLLQVTVPEIQAWEAETVELPRGMWLALASYVAKLEGRDHYDNPPPNPAETWRKRVIRVYPDFPVKSTQTSLPLVCHPC